MTTDQPSQHISQRFDEELAAVKSQLFETDGTPKKRACERFVEDCEHFQRRLVGMIQTCSGGPGRATEINVIQICNTDVANRHLFVSKGQVFFMTSYHKGRSMNEGVSK